MWWKLLIGTWFALLLLINLTDPAGPDTTGMFPLSSVLKHSHLKLYTFSFQPILHEPFWMRMKNLSQCLGQYSWGESSLPSTIEGNWRTSCSFSSPLPYFWPQCCTSWKRDSFHFCEVPKLKNHHVAWKIRREGSEEVRCNGDLALIWLKEGWNRQDLILYKWNMWPDQEDTGFCFQMSLWKRSESEVWREETSFCLLSLGTQEALGELSWDSISLNPHPLSSQCEI